MTSMRMSGRVRDRQGGRGRVAGGVRLRYPLIAAGRRG